MLVVASLLLHFASHTLKFGCLFDWYGLYCSDIVQMHFNDLSVIIGTRSLMPFKHATVHQANWVPFCQPLAYFGVSDQTNQPTNWHFGRVSNWLVSFLTLPSRFEKILPKKTDPTGQFVCLCVCVMCSVMLCYFAIADCFSIIAIISAFHQ